MTLAALSAHDIDIAGLALEVALPVEWLDRELADAGVEAAAPGRLEARLSRSGDSIVVRGRVHADVSVPCARCTDPVKVPVDTELSLLLRPAPVAAREAAAATRLRHHGGAEAHDHRTNTNGKTAPAAPNARDVEYEFSSAEADEDVYDGETVVLDAFIREAILLEVPNFPLCSEACPGIGPAATAPPEPQSRIDPRLAPLGALREKLAQKAAATGKRSSKPPPAPSPPKKKTNKE